MMESVAPPLFGEAPQRLCTRWLGSTNCGRLPAMHVLWNAETMDNGMTCWEHTKELGVPWEYVQAHELGPDCGMPNAAWFFEENTCHVVEDESALPASTTRPEAAPESLSGPVPYTAGGPKGE